MAYLIFAASWGHHHENVFFSSFFLPTLAMIVLKRQVIWRSACSRKRMPTADSSVDPQTDTESVGLVSVIVMKCLYLERPAVPLHRHMWGTERATPGESEAAVFWTQDDRWQKSWSRCLPSGLDQEERMSELRDYIHTESTPLASVGGHHEVSSCSN